MESLSRMLLVPLMLMGPVSCLDDDVMGIDAGPQGIDTSPEDSGGGDTDSDDRDTGEPRYSRCYEAGESPEGKAFACDWMTVEGATYMMGSPEGMAQADNRR